MEPLPDCRIGPNPSDRPTSLHQAVHWSRDRCQSTELLRSGLCPSTFSVGSCVPPEPDSQGGANALLTTAMALAAYLRTLSTSLAFKQSAIHDGARRQQRRPPRCYPRENAVSHDPEL